MSDELIFERGGSPEQEEDFHRAQSNLVTERAEEEVAHTGDGVDDHSQILQCQEDIIIADLPEEDGVAVNGLWDSPECENGELKETGVESDMYENETLESCKTEEVNPEMGDQSSNARMEELCCNAGMGEQFSNSGIEEQCNEMCANSATSIENDKNKPEDEMEVVGVIREGNISEGLLEPECDRNIVPQSDDTNIEVGELAEGLECEVQIENTVNLPASSENSPKIPLEATPLDDKLHFNEESNNDSVTSKHNCISTSHSSYQSEHSNIPSFPSSPPSESFPPAQEPNATPTQSISTHCDNTSATQPNNGNQQPTHQPSDTEQSPDPISQHKAIHSNSSTHVTSHSPSKHKQSQHLSSNSSFSKGSNKGRSESFTVNNIQDQLAQALSRDEDEDLDDIMSELDAELLSGPNVASLCSPTHSKDASHRRSSQEVTSSNGVVPSNVLRLQEHNRQLLDQLKIRDEEIRALCRERDAAKEALGQTPKNATPKENADDLYLPQIEELEKTIVQQQTDLQAARDKLLSHDAAARQAVTTIQRELKARVDQVTKMYEEAVREKDSMVVTFATSEARVMEMKKAMEKMDNRLKDVMRDKENLLASLKAAKVDKQKAVTGIEQKGSELNSVLKEMEKLKEAVSSSEYRVKWFQNKLKDELEAHKETKSSLDKTTAKLKETKEETEIIRRECQAIVKTYQESEEIKSNSLDKELKMKESQLRLQTQEWNDNQQAHEKTKQELESIKTEHQQAIGQVSSLKQQIKSLESSLSDKESMASQSNELLNKQKSDLSTLSTKVKEMKTLEDNFHRAQEMIQSLDRDISELKVSNRDLVKDMEACQQRESKMLGLQSELSRSNACLRSENTTLNNKVCNQTGEIERMKMELQQLDTTVKNLTDSLEEEKKSNEQAVASLTSSLNTKTQECSDFKQKWEDEIDANKTLKRRHASNVKDLTRQLQQAKRRLEVLEGNTEAMGSRSNSNGSLNSVADGNSMAAANHTSGGNQASAASQEFPVITEQVEIDKHVLIERIVRLQKSHARKNEKLEFLGEHIQQLLTEIKKKTKIIQSYVMREEAGTLSSEDSDANKNLLSRKGGIMASVYSLHQQDGTMTLDLSLQINKKLQAVLEDTLLKNITLKENLDTLGEEISRLSQVNRKLQLHLQDLENAKKT